MGGCGLCRGSWLQDLSTDKVASVRVDLKPEQRRVVWGHLVRTQANSIRAGMFASYLYLLYV